METPEYLVLFDGECNFCSSSVQFILRKEKNPQLKFVSLQSETAKKLLQPFSEKRNIPDSLVYISMGKIHFKSGAALHICRHLKFPWPFLYFLIIVPPFIRNFFYDWFAANRYRWFGKKNSCFVPTPEIKSRFLE